MSGAGADRQSPNLGVTSINQTEQGNDTTDFCAHLIRKAQQCGDPGDAADFMEAAERICLSASPTTEQGVVEAGLLTRIDDLHYFEMPDWAHRTIDEAKAALSVSPKQEGLIERLRDLKGELPVQWADCRETLDEAIAALTSGAVHDGLTRS